MIRHESIKTTDRQGIGYTLGTGFGFQAFSAGSSFPLTANTRIPALQRFDFASPTVDRQGRQIALHEHQAQFFTQDLSEQVALEMVLIPGSAALMSEIREKADTGSIQLLHQAALRPLFMAKYPVTQAQWQTVAGWPKVNRELDPQPACFKDPERPVESVSWLDTEEFCQRLSRVSGLRYHLPKESQWEYACRAGTQTPFHYGPVITARLANYSDAYRNTDKLASAGRGATVPVGRFAPNAFGLHDMHGNVWEWCADLWQKKPHSPLSFSYGRPAKQTICANWRSLRGGAWSDTPEKIRSDYRSMYQEQALSSSIGFRVACTI
jgi:formylglycine-generating enzyme required for sulfatase activity